MLFDLMLYRYPQLAQKVFQLLTMYFMRQGTVVDNLLDTQLLGEARSKAVLQDIIESKDKLLILKGSWGFWGQKNDETGGRNRKEVGDILSRLETYVDSKSFENAQKAKEELAKKPADSDIPEREVDSFKEDSSLEIEGQTYLMETMIQN